MSATGTCLCGAVAFELSAAPFVFQYCHCSRCRKTSGSAHAANLFVRPDELAWTRGADQVRTFKLPEARSYSHAFCETCGSAMPWLAGGGRAWIVPAGALDVHPSGEPTRNIHFASRAPWYIAAAALEVHEENPPR